MNVVFCMRIADCAVPTWGSTAGVCDECREPIWMAADTLGLDAVPVCNQCGPRMAIGDRTMFQITEATRARIKRELGMSDAQIDAQIAQMSRDIRFGD